MPVTISGSTGISGVDGSAGTPALIGSDADTGIFLAAGQVSASVNGTAGNVPLVSGTAKNSTSGTSIDFSPADNTGIPSWAKRVTVMFSGVSTSGTSPFLIQLGAGSVTTTGYVSQACQTAGSNGHTTSTAGLVVLQAAVAADLYYGIVRIATLGSNLWSSNGVLATSTAGRINHSAGGTSTALSGTLDRIRITTVNGTDTFDAGSINIMYE